MRTRPIFSEVQAKFKGSSSEVWIMMLLFIKLSKKMLCYGIFYNLINKKNNGSRRKNKIKIFLIGIISIIIFE